MFVVFLDKGVYFLCFFFSSRRRHTRSLRDWSSDVCSSDLPEGESRSNWQVMRLLAHALGLRDQHFAKDEPTLIREVLASGDPSVAGITYERLREERSVRLVVGRTYRPFLNGAPTP